MRSDMHKVIVERPRRRSAWTLKNKKTALRIKGSGSAGILGELEDYDSGPCRAPSSRHGKHLNENLNPLERYLVRQVGRPWDKVYSEIRAIIDPRSAVRLHVLQHLEHMVATNVVFRDRVPWEYSWRGFDPVDGLYVHPATGLLRRTKEVPRRRWNRMGGEPDYIPAGPTTEYEKIDGSWFCLTTRAPRSGETLFYPDGTGVSADAFKWRPPVVLVAKRQCDRKTIRRIEAGEYGPLQVRRHAILFDATDAARRGFPVRRAG